MSRQFSGLEDDTIPAMAEKLSTDNSHNDKLAHDVKLDDSDHDHAAPTGRRESVALNIVENPLKVDIATPQVPCGM